MARFNARKRAQSAIEDWAASNPRGERETVAAYRRRMRDGVTADLQADGDGSAWLTILLQLLPLLIEWFTKRKT